MTRLSVVDEIFLRTHRGLGVPILLQGLWILKGPVDPTVLDGLAERLSEGPLGRRVVSPTVPGARRRWLRNTDRPPVIEYETIASHAVLAWAERQGDVDLDPERGTPWRLSVAPIDDGGTALCLVCSHAVADARLLIRAVDAAITGTTAPVSGPDGSDLVDAASVLATVSVRTAGAVAGLVVSRARRSALSSYVTDNRSTPEHVATELWSPPALVASFSAAEWDAVAAVGGTPNALFAALIADTVRTIVDRDTINLGVPVSQRAPGSAAANALSMSELRVRSCDSLADIRTAAKTAYRTPVGGPAGFPDELLHVVPARVAEMMAPNPGQRDALCSNIGMLPDSFTLGGRSTRVAARAIHPGLTARRAATMRTTLSAYLSRFENTYTLCLTGTSPTRTPTVGVLQDALDRASARWNLTGSSW